MSGRRSSTDRNSRARSLVRRPCGASARCPAGGISLRDARGQPGRPASSDPRASFRRTGSDGERVVPTPAVRDRRVHPAAAARPDHDPLPDVIEVLERYAATARARWRRARPRLDQIRFPSPIIAHVLAFAADRRQDCGYVSASVESAAPTLGRRELCQVVPVRDMVGRRRAGRSRCTGGRAATGTTEAAEQPGVSARTVERLVAASRQSVQPGMARGCQGVRIGARRAQ